MKGIQMSLVNAIEFEIHNFTTNTSVQFLIPDTNNNYELIAAQRFTRSIKFVKVFDFQYRKEVKAPAFILESLVMDYLESLNEMREGFDIIDSDEMVGAF